MSAQERASFREAVGPGLVEFTRAIAAERDLGARELETAASFAKLFAELDETLVDEALDAIASAPHGAAVLDCLVTAGSTELAVRASVRLEELGDQPAVPLLTVSQAWRLSAPDAPVVSIAALCEREGEKGAQLFTFVLDHEMGGGAVKLGFASGLRDGKRVAKGLTEAEHSDVTLEPIDSDAARAAIVAAAIAGARGGWRPDDDGLLALRIFLRASRAVDADAIVQAIELGESLPDAVAARDELEWAEAEEVLLVAAAAWFDTHGLDRTQREWGLKALELMLAFSSAEGIELADWRGEEVEDFLLVWVPTNVTMDTSATARFPGAVSDALHYVVAADLLDQAAGAALEQDVQSLREDFDETMRDTFHSGPASALVAAMHGDGVDVTDNEAVQAWLQAFNARSWEERDAVLGPALEPIERETTSVGRAQSQPKKRTARKAQRKARRRNRG